MKLRSMQRRQERGEGSSKGGTRAGAEQCTTVGPRKRRRRSAHVSSGNGEELRDEEGVSVSTEEDEDGKAKDSSRGKRSRVRGGHGKGRNEAEGYRGNVGGDGGDGANLMGTVKDVVLRSRCTLRTIIALHGRMSREQRDAVMGTALRPVLEYGEMAMERHLTLALIKSWDRRMKAFRVAGRLMRFTVFDVVLFTGLPGTGKKVELDGEEVGTEVGDMVRARMDEWERREMEKRVPRKSGKKRRFFRHYVNVMMELCEENAEEDRLGIWLRLYAFIVLSGVLFPRTPYGAAWSLLCYADDVQGMGQYAWAEAVWQVVVDTIEDTQRKLSAGSLSEVQLNGFCLLIQVWLYEHTTRFGSQDGERFPRIASWRKVDHGGIYDATELLAELGENEVKPILYPRAVELEEAVVRQYMETDEYRFYVDDSEGVLSFDERLRRAREAYTQEKEAHRRTREEVALMRAKVEELQAQLLKFGEGAAATREGASTTGGGQQSPRSTEHGNGRETDTQNQGNGERGRSDDGEMDTQNQGVGSVGDTDDGNDGQMELQDQWTDDAGGTVERGDGTDVPGGSSPPTVIDQVQTMPGDNHPGLGDEDQLQPKCHLPAAEQDQSTQLRAPPDVPQRTTECVEYGGSGPHVTEDDGRATGRTTDSATRSEGDAAMGEQPSAAADGGCTIAEVGMCTTATGRQKDTSRRTSNMFTRLKREPRVRKASRVRGSPYTNPLRAKKSRTRLGKSTPSSCIDAGLGTAANPEGEVRHEDEVVIVPPIATAGGEVVLGTVADAARKDNVPTALKSVQSPTIHGAGTWRRGSSFAFTEQAVTSYLTWPLSTEDVELLAAVRTRCKGLKGSQWNFDLPQAVEDHVNAEFLKGLINVVPTRGPGDRPNRYCVGAFAVNLYCKLLRQRQREHTRYCRGSVFLDRHDEAALQKLDGAARTIWESVKLQKIANFCYVFMPLFECVADHWLLLVADVKMRRFLVYDSLQSKRDAPRQQLLLRGKIALGLSLMKIAEFTDVLKWELQYPDCPQQENGHDCGVYLMMFMDLLSLRADGLYFGQQYVRHVREKLLLSFLRARIAHFPEALLHAM